MSISNWFFRLGVLSVLVGMALGVWMGKEENFTLSAVHAHLNLLGYVSMFLYGFFYRIFPIARQNPMAKMHFALAVLGVALMVPALAMVLLQDLRFVPVLIAGEVAAVLGMLVFAYIVFRSTGERAPAAGSPAAE